MRLNVQSYTYTEPLFQTVMFIHQIIFKIWGKITELWNIGHSDLLFRGQMSGHTKPLSQTVMFIHQMLGAAARLEVSPLGMQISTAILPLLLIQEEQLSVTGERMCTKYR